MLRNIIVNICGALSFCYLFSFLLYSYTGCITSTVLCTLLYTLFVDYRVVIPCFVVCVLSFVELGKLFARTDVEQMRYKIFKDMHRQENRLIDYMKLAKIITKDDADVIIRRYIERLEKDNNMTKDE